MPNLLPYEELLKSYCLLKAEFDNIRDAAMKLNEAKANHKRYQSEASYEKLRATQNRVNTLLKQSITKQLQF